MLRRAFLAASLALAAPLARGEPTFARVEPGTTLRFPRDHGSHPDFRTEWWYITAWLRSQEGIDYGTQVTFFRTRPGIAEDSASAFAPRELLFAHAAVADPRHGRLRHDQRAARTGFGLAQAARETTDVRLGDWSLALGGDTYRALVVARDFAFDLRFSASQPLLLQGDSGLSRKGPRPEHASYYYSRPNLVAQGSMTVAGRDLDVTGSAWLDHEWSSSYLAPGARGWDWIGINLDDGGGLMAFRIRGAGDEVLWAGGAVRNAQGATRVLGPHEVRFVPRRGWRSPRTGIDYPVEFEVHAGDLVVTLAPLLDDAELDSRASVGTIYWEGAVRARAGGRDVGRGYLELTGYGGALKM
jgi:predicted secreted hydrolase